MTGRQLQHARTRCKHCGACLAACPTGALHADGEKIAVDQAHCQLCGACTEACWTGALSMIGRKLTKQELLAALKKDRDVFPDFGGLTVSGGEPLLQAAQLAEILPAVKAAGYHVAVDTAADVPWDRFAAVLPYTGADNSRILDNYARLTETNVQLYIRVPLVHAVNDTEENIALMHDFLKRFPPAERLELLHYHNLGRAKAEGLGWDQALFQAPEAARILQIRDALEGCAKAILIS